LRPYRTVEDKIDGVVITFVDITDRKAWENRQTTLLGELTHRVKNTLAVVQSIAHLSEREGITADAFITEFEGRLSALAVSHSLLVESDWQGADLSALVRQQLDPFIAGSQTRLIVEGEPMTLLPDIAGPFGLILHELATNAAKYGALSVPTGKIDTRWVITKTDSEKVLTFTWQEIGGPQVHEPDRAGFGSLLIERGIPDSKVKRNYHSSGQVCTIEFPLREYS
jgi:two-component system, chemotaxis family, CheB/CheR fusion protein